MQQAEVGIDLVSDGEFGKTISWSRYILERLERVRGPARPEPRRRPTRSAHSARAPTSSSFPEFYAEYNATQGFEDVMRNPVCVGPISYAGHDALQRDIANVKAAVDAARNAGHEVAAFLPVVAPASVAYKRQDVYYASEEEYVYAVAEALREEYRAIIDAGLMLQVDDAHLPMMYDNIVDPGTPDDFRRWARLRIDALNHALDGIPQQPQPLSHLLGQLQLTARRRRAVPRDRRPRAVGQRRRLRDRDGQPAPRARVARLARTCRCPTTAC